MIGGISAVPFLAISGLFLQGGQPPDSVLIFATDECRSCAVLEYEPSASFGSINDPVSPGTRSTVATDGDRFFVSPLEAVNEEIAIYGRDGFVGTVGGAGEGPGEYLRIHGLSFSEGVLHVFSNGRVTLLDQNLEVSGTRLLPGRPIRALALDRNTSLVNTWLGSPEGSGFQFHYVSGEGVRSFGIGLEIIREESQARRFYNIIGRAQGPGFWSAEAFTYRFVEWGRNGAVSRVVRVVSDWFPEEVSLPESGRNPFQQKPPPTLVAIREDEFQRLWVATLVPKGDWQPLDVEPSEFRDRYPEIMETRVEVFDLRTATRIASAELPFYVTGILENGFLVARERDGYGIQVIHVFDVKLRERTRE